MLRKTPLPHKREHPRRNDGRVTHVRTKRRRGDRTAAEARHIARVAELRCCVTYKQDIHVHHLLKAPGKRAGRDHRWIVPLNPLLHTDGGCSVHRLGSEAAFERMWDLPEGFLIAEAARLWAESEALDG